MMKLFKMKLLKETNIKNQWFISLCLKTAMLVLYSLGIFSFVSADNFFSFSIIFGIFVILINLFFAYMLYLFSYQNNGTKLLLFDLIATASQIGFKFNLNSVDFWSFFLIISSFISFVISAYYLICSFYLYEINRDKELEKKFVVK